MMCTCQRRQGKLDCRLRAWRQEFWGKGKPRDLAPKVIGELTPICRVDRWQEPSIGDHT